MSSELVSENPVVKAVVEGKAPRPAQLAAARGALPLPQNDLLEILVSFFDGADEELRTAASETLAAQSHESLESTIRTSNVAPRVLAHFSARTDLTPSIQEAIVTNTATPPDAIAHFARRTQNAPLLELISFNQQLLIQNPAIIDAIVANPNRTPDTERRVLELKKEFFEKERGAQQIANELRAKGNDAAAEFIEQAEFSEAIGSESGMSLEDALFLAEHIEVPDQETDDSWLALEYIEEIYEETEEQRQAALKVMLGELQADDEATSERISMLNRIMRMGVKDRVKLAMKGDREARNILIRDPNKLVSTAVVNNPRITEKEVENIAAMRSMSEEILRQLAANRQWSRSYPIMHNLARNPRTPIANAITIMNRLQLRDLIALSKNRNVSDAVRRQALRLHTARTGGANRG
jgi:phosphosulfolactate phosphohydrolase-like enzyme